MYILNISSIPFAGTNGMPKEGFTVDKEVLLNLRLEAKNIQGKDMPDIIMAIDAFLCRLIHTLSEGAGLSRGQLHSFSAVIMDESPYVDLIKKRALGLYGVLVIYPNSSAF